MRKYQVSWESSGARLCIERYATMEEVKQKIRQWLLDLEPGDTIRVIEL